VHAAALSPVAGATQAADVWALGITACEILFYNDPVGMKLEQLGLLTPGA